MNGTEPEIGLAAAWQPPMANGEVIFEAPWQGRVFGMAVALAEQGRFTWEEFQASLIEVIGAADRDAQPGDPYAYYVHFAEALGRLLARKGLVGDNDLGRREQEYAARPHDHDHGHDHGHQHHH